MAGTPYHDAGAVTPSDTIALPVTTRALYVGGAGNIVALMQGGQVVTFTAVPVGTTLHVAVTRVNATLTTATNLVWLV